MADYKQLCADLVDVLIAHGRPDAVAASYVKGLLTRARAALAEPEPEGQVVHLSTIMNKTFPAPTEDRDPWKDRSERMRCKSCMWFAPKERADGITDIGRCRCHAPTMNGYPVVFEDDWCGDHKLNENWPS